MQKIRVLGAGSVGLLHAMASPQDFVLVQRGMGISKLVPVTVNRLDSTKITANICEEYMESAQEPIDTLLVCTKAYQAYDALKSIQTRLHDQTTTILLTNGVLKVYETVKDLLPPNVWLGLTTHGIVRNSKHEITHTGMGNTMLGMIPGSKDNQMLDKLVESWKDLNYTHATDIRHRLLIKLAVNSCINPTVALLGTRNGYIAEDIHSQQLIRQLCLEMEPIFNIDHETLYKNVMTVVHNTKMNQNSMLVDLMMKRKTEIEYLNGHVVDMGLKMGLKTDTHQCMLNLIKSKEGIKNTFLIQ